MQIELYGIHPVEIKPCLNSSLI